MGLLGQIAQKQEDKKVVRCSVGLKIQALSKEDRKDLQEALDDPRFYGTVIAGVLGVGEYALRRHRRNKCRCADLMKDQT